MRTGLFGGAFNPFHNGHLEIARTAIREAKLDRVILIPSGNAPHKKESKAVSREKRLEMVKRAVSGEEKMEVSDYELCRNEVSYSAETVEHFRRIYPEDELFFIVGDDSYNALDKWFQPHRITAVCTMLVFPREGAQVKPPAVAIPMPRVEVSSSKIREKIKSGKDFANLLPKSVFDYIIEERLYTD